MKKLFLFSILIFSFMAMPNLRAAETMQLFSPAFENGNAIPKNFSCEGENVSPPLKWKGSPKQTQSFAIIVDDPDAPMPQPFVHWVIFNIPPMVTNLPEAMPRISILANNEKQGNNGFGKLGYYGACPPLGNHHYHFTLYALDTMLALAPGASKEDVLKAMEGHILARAYLLGRYIKIRNRQS
jgi:Raf kinase inhibitor-like YbhB/YbcL family protein